MRRAKTRRELMVCVCVCVERETDGQTDGRDAAVFAVVTQ